MKILLAEDEKTISSHVCRHLEQDGYKVIVCSDGEQAWETGGTEQFDAVILDLGLPSLDGLTLLRRWRSEGNDVPVLVLTARGSWMERVDGFDSGADDYLPKPFRIEELKARLRAMLRRSGPIRSTVINAASDRLRINPESREAFLDGEALSLTPSEFRALCAIAASGKKPVTPWELAERALDRDDDRAKNAAEVLINRLRRKIGTDIIANRRGFGYLIVETDE